MYKFSNEQISETPELCKIVSQYFMQTYQKPILPCLLETFHEIQNIVATDKIILDSCCGTGYSTSQLAKKYPDHYIIGIDKSLHRLSKHEYFKKYAVTNAIAHHQNVVLVHADVLAMWRLIESGNVAISRHFMFYPNPYPKASQIKKRFYAHPILPTFINITSSFECRSNWLLYLNEFSSVLTHFGYDCYITEFDQTVGISRFEVKYLQSKCKIYRLKAKKQGQSKTTEPTLFMGDEIKTF